MMLSGIPVNLVTGRDGAAKSGVLSDMLERRPAGARWAVLINHAGTKPLPACSDGIYFSEVTQGCVCCTAQLPLRVGLTRLLRETEPERLFIQAPAHAHTADIVRLLTDQWLAPVLSLRATVHVIAGAAVRRDLLDDALAAQLAAAQVVAIDVEDLDEAALGDVEWQLSELPTSPKVIRWQAGCLGLELLDLPGRFFPGLRFQVGEPKPKR